MHGAEEDMLVLTCIALRMRTICWEMRFFDSFDQRLLTRVPCILM